MSDLAAGLVGRAGRGAEREHRRRRGVVRSGSRHGAGHRRKGIANPTALLMSAIMMLDYMGENEIARRVENALHLVYREGRSLTRDVGGKATTAEFTDAVIGGD